MGRQDATITDRPKKIHTEGLTFGADRQIGDNDFAGVALRYAQNNSGVIFTDQTSKMDSLTLNFYGTSQTEGISHTNMILGYSLLRIDQKYKGKKLVIETANKFLLQQILEQKKIVGDLI